MSFFTFIKILSTLVLASNCKLLPVKYHSFTRRNHGWPSASLSHYPILLLPTMYQGEESHFCSGLGHLSLVVSTATSGMYLGPGGHGGMPLPVARTLGLVGTVECRSSGTHLGHGGHGGMPLPVARTLGLADTVECRYQWHVPWARWTRWNAATSWSDACSSK